MYNLVKGQYELGCDISNFVTLGAITPEEYKQITGHDYGASEETRYYLPIIDKYLSLDKDKKTCLLDRGNFDYQQTFIQAEIDDLQAQDGIKDKLDLEKCKELS